VVHLTQGSNNLHFFYGADGSPAIVEYNGVSYGYVKNLQGDVIGIVNASGAYVVQYAYDAWDRLLSKTGSMAATLGTLNPFRYRGYVYDEETGLYYLRSRYYNPVWCRFLNADLIYTGNLFAYCRNMPTICYDKTGYAMMCCFDACGFGNLMSSLTDGFGGAGGGFEVMQYTNHFSGAGGQHDMEKEIKIGVEAFGRATVKFVESVRSNLSFEFAVGYGVGLDFKAGLLVITALEKYDPIYFHTDGWGNKEFGKDAQYSVSVSLEGVKK